MADLSPMMKQYFEIKEQHPNTLLFFRLGDFYELFFEDVKSLPASWISRIDLDRTGLRAGGASSMCGVPFHSCETYIARLVAKGYKVSICEQMENPAQAKGLVKRDVIRVITPGTVMESSMLDETRNNFIASLYAEQNRAGVCFETFLPVSCTPPSYWLSLGGLEQQLKNELGRFSPKEILIYPEVLEYPAIGENHQRKAIGSAGMYG